MTTMQKKAMMTEVQSSPPKQIITFTITMRTSVIIAFFCMVVMASANQNFRKLEKIEPRLGCDLQEIIACEQEIEVALADCGHLTNIDEIMTCINDVSSFNLFKIFSWAILRLTVKL